MPTLVFSGTLIKQEIADQTKLGEAVRLSVEENEPIQTSLVTQIITNRLTQLDASTHGWIMHGFPMNREQAEVFIYFNNSSHV